MRVGVLGSGSQGNSTLVECGGTRVLVDAGFSGRSLEQRLEVLGVGADEIQAILITHDHGDHIRGAGIFARRHGVDVFVTPRTLTACKRTFRGRERIHEYRPGQAFTVGDIRVESFLTVHDAADPVGLTLVDRSTEARVGIATDLGRPTAQVRHALSGCDFLILEANHDDMLLRTGPYPWSVIRRIASSHGHLSNRAAARFAVDLLHPRLAGVLLAHLSVECNDRDLAEDTVGTALKRAGYEGYLAVARQDRPTDFMDIEDLRLKTGPVQYSFL